MSLGISNNHSFHGCGIGNTLLCIKLKLIHSDRHRHLFSFCHRSSNPSQITGGQFKNKGKKESFLSLQWERGSQPESTMRKVEEGRDGGSWGRETLGWVTFSLSTPLSLVGWVNQKPWKVFNCNYLWMQHFWTLNTCLSTTCNGTVRPHQKSSCLEVLADISHR